MCHVSLIYSLLSILLLLQERALNMLRNQCANILDKDDPKKLVQQLLQWSCGELFGLLISRVDAAASHPVSHRVHALYALCNIAGAGAVPRLVGCDCGCKLISRKGTRGIVSILHGGCPGVRWLFLLDYRSCEMLFLPEEASRMC